MAIESVGASALNTVPLNSGLEPSSQKTLAQSIVEAKAEAQANVNDGDETPGAAGKVDKLA